MTEKKPKPPPPGFSAFKKLLAKVAKVPKREVDEKEAEYQRQRAPLRRRSARDRQAG